MCVSEAAAHGAKRPHAREVLFDALSLLPMGGEKNLKGMGEVAVHGTKSLHTKEDNIMQYHASCEWVDPLTDLCGRMVDL